MHSTPTLLAGGAALMLAAFQPAGAHVTYKDLSDPFLSPGGVNGATFTNFGWHLGTTPTLGDSHELAGGELFKFHLSEAGLVTITFSDDGGAGALNPAFSLYRGLLPDDAHDDTPFDPLNPKAGLPPVKVASPVDDGIATDGAGRVSPFRDTANVEYAGQFDALNSWSMANDGDEWSVLEYLTHVGPAGGNAVVLNAFFLGAGDYTLAAGGGVSCGALPCIEGLPGTIRLSVTAVPEPSAAWLIGGGLALLACLRRRARRN